MDGVDGEDVAERRVKVVAEEREAGPVGQHHHAEVRMQPDHLLLLLAGGVGLVGGDVVARDDAPTVGQEHFAALNQRLSERIDTSASRNTVRLG